MIIDSSADNALIDMDEYFLLSGEDATNPNIKQGRIKALINHASQLIEDYCSRKFIKPDEAITEIFDGDGTSEYIVRHLRINDTPSFEYRLNTTWTSLNATTYPISYDQDSGRTWFTKYNNTFWEGSDNWRITYSYGWLLADIPVPIKTACFELLQRMMMLIKEKEGLESESFGDSSTTYNLSKKIPENIQIILDPYRSYRNAC